MRRVTARHHATRVSGALLGCLGFLVGDADPVSAQAADRVRAEVRRTIGEIDGPVALTAVVDLVVAGDRLFASQPIESRVRVLSLEGQPLGFVGGGGQGPGEFRRLDFLGYADSTLLVVDLGLRRETRFALDGSMAGTRRLPSVPSKPPVSFIAPIYPAVQDRTIVYGTVPIHVPAADFPFAPGVIVDASGVVLDTVPSLRSGDRTVIVDSGGHNFAFTRPIFDAAIYAMSSNGRYLAVADREGEQVVVRRYDTERLEATTIETGLGDVRVPEAVADSVESELVERTVASRPQLGRRAIERAMTIPRVVMGADHVTVLASGEMWLRRPDFGPGPDTWLVLAPDGARRVEVEVPHGVRVAAREGRYVWGTLFDALGVSYIVQMEAPLPWG